MVRPTRLSFSLALLGALLLTPSLILAQPTAPTAPTALRGRIVDPQGGALTGASVTLSGGMPARRVKTAVDGSFLFDDVPDGDHRVAAEAPGFARAERTVTAADRGAAAEALTLTLRVDAITEDVRVTAPIIAGTSATGKTTLPLRDLPMTIDTVSAAQLDEQGARTLVEALANVPNANAFTTYGVYEYYAFRGFLDSVQLVDGVRNEGNRTNTQLTNIERVDVLKGPSSALYGGGAFGATVNLIRKKPSPTPAYDFVAGSGSWNTYRAAFGATGGLGTSAALYRLDAGTESSEGYRHNDTTRLSVTPSLAWHVGRNQINAYYTFNRDRFSGDAGLPLIDEPSGAPAVNSVLDVPRDRNYRTPQDDATSHDHNLQVVFARQVTNRIGFRNTTSYRHFNDEYFLTEGLTFDAPRTVLRDYLYFMHHRRPLTNLAEVTGRFGGRVAHDIVAGWEGQRYHNYTTLPEEDFFSATPIDAFDPIESQGPPDLTPARKNVFTNNTHGFYAQDHITLGARLMALVGGRYDIYRRESRADRIGPGGDVTGLVTRRDAEAFTGRVGLVYRPATNVDVYGSFANAFKPLTVAQPDGRSLDPERARQFEIGNRLRFLRDRVLINSSVYHLLRENVAFRRPGNIYIQAGEVRSRGLEVDLQTTLAGRFRLQAGYGFTDAAFLDYATSPTVNLRGNRPVFAPRHTFSAWTGYDWANGLGVNAGVRHIGRTFADQENRFVIDGYGTLNLAVRYRRGIAEYAVNVNNATNTRYLTAHQDYLQVYPGNPTNVLATVRLHLK